MSAQLAQALKAARRLGKTNKFDEYRAALMELGRAYLAAFEAAPQQAQAPNLHAMQMLWDDQSSEERAHYMAVAARIANEDAAQQQAQQAQEQP